MDNAMYDYIVVGTGPAGAVIANRLSADGQNRVLVLEAGDNNDKDPLIMGANTNLYAHTPEFFWPGETGPQSGLAGAPLAIGHGRTSGGGSSVNGEMYVRPTPYVLARWEEAAGEKWNAENVTRHFRELENFNGCFAETDVHGYQGDLHIRQPLQQTPALVEKLVSAMERATGLDRIDDYNDPRTPMGPFARFQVYQKPDGSRASASVSFLGNEVCRRPNLTVLNRATATKVIFEDKTAKGVEFIHEGVGKQAFASKKVIVSAGIHSVQLLMLSGIGPHKTLENFGIPVLYDNPNVGSNLAGDAMCGATFRVSRADGDELTANDPNAKWAGGAFLPDPRGARDSQERGIQIIATYAGDGMLRFIILNVKPKSHGVSTILSRDPLKTIFVDYRFLTDPDDMAMLKSMLREYVAKIGEELAKIDPAYGLISPTQEELADDTKLEQFIIANFNNNSYHDQCQLRMGREEEGAVVNPSGEVYGVKNLIVADASIIPYHVDGNTSAPAYIIGATIAEGLLE